MNSIMRREPAGSHPFSVKQSGQRNMSPNLCSCDVHQNFCNRIMKGLFCSPTMLDNKPINYFSCTSGAFSVSFVEKGDFVWPSRFAVAVVGMPVFYFS